LGSGAEVFRPDVRTLSPGRVVMIVIIGCIIVIGAVLGGFTWAGGHVGALIHPSEVLTIGGASLGALVMMSSKKVLVDLFRGIVVAIKGSPYDKRAYAELFGVSYEILRKARKDGLLAIESHLSDPHKSEIFKKYPRLMKNHHAVQFLADGFGPLIDGSADRDKLAHLLEIEIGVMEREHHMAVGVLQKSADALPGFGIVAAVLGIVITMGAIDGPVEEIGHKVGAALVGTFLGILASYGFLGPLAARMELLGECEMEFYKTASSLILSCAGECAPKVAVEQARRGVGSEFRPDRASLEKMMGGADAA
jgi:chemotaxis protein MotA